MQTEQKIFFFRNMGAPGMLRSPLGIMQVLYYGDTYPKFPTGLRWLERLVSLSPRRMRLTHLTSFALR
jgi:hypothetical protein